MKKKELLSLIEEGENLRCEFKLMFSTHEKIAKELIAFANTSGGYLLIGIDDDKRIIGVNSEKAEIDLLIETAEKYCEPPLIPIISNAELSGKDIIVVYVPPSKNKPHRLQDFQKFDINNAQVYIRVNDKSILASKEMVRIMKSHTDSSTLIKYSLGNLEKTTFELLRKKETLTVDELCEAANVSYRRASRTLVKLVRAGLLLIHTKDNGEEYFTSTL